MTVKTYSEFQRLLGKFEGIGECMPEEHLDYYICLLQEFENLIEAHTPEDQR